MKYESVQYAMDKYEAESIFAQEDSSKIALALVSLGYVDDFKWVCHLYLKYMHHHNTVLARAAVIGIGHLARLSSQFHVKKKRFVQELNKVAFHRFELRGTVNETLSDIDIFTKKKPRKIRNTKK